MCVFSWRLWAEISVWSCAELATCSNETKEQLAGSGDIRTAVSEKSCIKTRSRREWKSSNSTESTNMSRTVCACNISSAAIFVAMCTKMHRTGGRVGCFRSSSGHLEREVSIVRVIPCSVECRQQLRWCAPSDSATLPSTGDHDKNKHEQTSHTSLGGATRGIHRFDRTTHQFRYWTNHMHTQAKWLNNPIAKRSEKPTRAFSRPCLQFQPHRAPHLFRRSCTLRWGGCKAGHGSVCWRGPGLRVVCRCTLISGLAPSALWWVDWSVIAWLIGRAIG